MLYSFFGGCHFVFFEFITSSALFEIILDFGNQCDFFSNAVTCRFSFLAFGYRLLFHRIWK
jgi:hypothetical protein